MDLTQSYRRAESIVKFRAAAEAAQTEDWDLLPEELGKMGLDEAIRKEQARQLLASAVLSLQSSIANLFTRSKESCRKTMIYLLSSRMKSSKSPSLPWARKRQFFFLWSRNGLTSGSRKSGHGTSGDKLTDYSVGRCQRCISPLRILPYPCRSGRVLGRPD